MCIWYLCVCVPICIYVTVYLYMHGARMYFTLAIKPGFPGLRGVSKTSVWLGVMMSCFAGQKKTQLLLKAEMFFFVFAMVFTWVSQGERNKNKDLRLFLWVVCRQLISSSGELSPHVPCIFLLFRFYKGAEFLLSYMGNIFWHYNSDAEKSMDYLPTLRWAMKTGPLKTLIVFWY